MNGRILHGRTAIEKFSLLHNQLIRANLQIPENIGQSVQLNYLIAGWAEIEKTKNRLKGRFGLVDF